MGGTKLINQLCNKSTYISSTKQLHTARYCRRIYELFLLGYLKARKASHGAFCCNLVACVECVFGVCA